MELNLEVVLSSSIKRKKPWPRFCWLGQEKESVFLLDDKRISEINLVSGRTKKRTPKLHPLLNNVVTMRSSSNGMWLCGLLKTGELFMWNRDKDLLKTTTTVPEVADFISCVQGNATRLYLQVSGDGMRVLLVAVTGQVFLWQCEDVRDFMGVRDCSIKGNWTCIQPTSDTILPTSQDKEACVHALFVQTEALGDACLSTFVFTSGKKLVITCLQINWGENQENTGPVSYSVKWATKTLPMSDLSPPCQPVKSRGAIVPVFSPDGQLLAIALNQRQPQGTQVLFVSTVNFVSVSRNLGGCGCKKMQIPSKYSRSYWVGDLSWSAGGLLLACVLKRGSLLMLARLGGLLTLSTCGCNIDFGPSNFLPLHPLVTYRPPSTVGKEEASLSSSSLSMRDVMRQRYSVTWHSQLFYFIVSDGYMATVVRVLDKISPVLLFKTQLKDTTMDLEKTSQSLETSQKHAKAWLDSVSSLHLEKNFLELGSTYRPNTIDITSTDGAMMPIFLQDQGAVGNPRDLLETVQNFFEDDSDLEGVPAGSHVEDGGHLEFASMFDTLHALNAHYEPFLNTDSEEESTVGQEITLKMEKMQSKLLTAWAFGMSLENSVELKYPLWKHAVKCAVRFVALSQLMPSSIAQFKNAVLFMLDFLKKLLYFVPLERANSQGPHFLGLMVELCRNLVQLVLTPYTESYRSGICEISSHNLSAALQVIEMVSQSLDHTYSLQQRSVWSSGKESSQPLQPCPLDLHSVPLLQDEIKVEENFSLVPPSRRLHGVWRLIYNTSQKYLKELHKFEDSDNLEREKQQLVVIMSKIQMALQSSGEKLEEQNKLLNYTGEHLFLSGLYTESSEVLYSQLLEISTKSVKCSAFKEKRLCLALLYSLLSQYHLKKAQEFGDHMACLILENKGHQKDGHIDYFTAKEESVPCLWLPTNVNTDTAYAVVQTLGRFMASYFSNQTLYILPPHSVDVLPPIHLTEASVVGRLVPLCQEEVAKAVRQQQLSEIWTVEYAQDMLLLGGLLPESVWLAYHLGDWKAAVSLSLAYSCYCTQHFDFTGVNKRELHLPEDLESASILQTELKSLLSSNKSLGECREIDANQSVTDPVDENDWGLLQISIRDILKAAVMAGVDVVSSPLSSLLDKAKGFCSSLTAMVPTALYLPSPPLYCPQPSLNTQDPAWTFGYHAEVISRHKIAQVIQQLFLLLRSAHCCYSAAQWYLHQLRRARHILYKMKKKYSYPSADLEEKSFPDGLMKFLNRSGHFKSKKDMDPCTIQTMICFRELCGLCWMLHVRDQLSITCRKYQADKQQARDDQISEESAVRPTCADALQWAQRFLPFSRFLNCEDILQDTLLSLLSELPPVLLVADALVFSFPEEEESIRVSLREKYNILIQTLGQCKVIDAGKETGETMMVVIQDKLRLRKKHFGRLRRHLASLELHLWEKDEEDEDYRSKHGMAMLRQLSLGTSLSTSTLTDCGLLPLCSDADTTEYTSETPVSPDHQNKSMTRTKKFKIQDRGDEIQTAQRVSDAITEEGQSGDAKEKDYLQKTTMKQPVLPSVGSWEFELEDKEYLNFLELFLSYLLEKDTADCPSELPLLKGFSHKLREKELHSLTFDVLTTMHRRQRDGHHPERRNSEPPVFRPGSCFRPVSKDTKPTCAVSRLFSLSHDETSLSSSPKLSTDVHKGLFSHWRKQWEFSQKSRKSSHDLSKTSPLRSDLPLQQLPGCLKCCCVTPVVDLKQGIDTKLEAQFPELGRLLEWMMRWADKRLLRGQHGKKRGDEGTDAGETTDGGVVIRVKASTPAVLTSLWLTERRLTALLGTGLYIVHPQIQETQWIVAPVMEPPTDRKVERENSVHTGYSASANTPTTAVKSSLQQEPEEQIFYTSHLIQDQNTSHSDSPIRAVPLQSYEVVNATLEEDRHTHSKGWEQPSSVSSEICSPGTSLRLEDLKNSQNQQSSATQLSNPSIDLEPQTCSADKPEGAFYDLGLNAQSLSQGAEIPSHQTTPSAVPTTVPFAPDQASMNPPPQMRQRLGEDLYRLVQNINYMSLMEVLGASFSNLQLAQQNASMAQSNLNSHVNVPNVQNVMPSPNVVPSPLVARFHSCQPNPPLVTPDSPVCANKTSAAIRHSVDIDLQTTASGAFSSRPILSGGQEMAPLSVQAGSPVRNNRDNLIPVSEGLLATTDVKRADHAIPVLPPSNYSIQNDTAPLLSGLKLLQLRPPHLPTFVPRQGPLPPQNYSSQDSSPPRCKYNGQTGYVRNQASSAVPVSSYLDEQMSGRFRGQDVLLLPQTLPVQATSTPQGLRLLHIQPVSSTNIALPKLPTKTFLKPSASICVPIGETPRIKLLQIDPQPKMQCKMLPLQASLSKIAHLTPENLSAVAQNDDSTKVQLLKIEKPTDTSNKPTVFQNANKRQKRREKLGKAVKTEVTFRPNDSIIPQDITDDTETVTVPEEPILEQDPALLSGPLRNQAESLVEKAFATAAELHAFASTSKRPPEQCDAFTNTDPDSSIHVDQAVVSENGTKSPLLRKENSRTYSNYAFQDQLQHLKDNNLSPDGHQFISVVDLEDKSQHQDLSPCPNSQPSVCTDRTAADLHIMATRVLRNDAVSQASVEQTNYMLNDRTTVVQSEESVLQRHHVLEEELAADIGESEAEICGAIKTQALAHSSLSQQPTVSFSSQMSQLDTQLAALQHIADSLESDFLKSRMLVNITEKSTPIPTSEKRTSIAVKKTVRLHIPAERWTPQNGVPSEVSENEPIRPSTAGLTEDQSPPKRTYTSAEFPEISNNLGDVTEDEAELSDTVEILDQLVREGFLSPTDLDLTISSAEHQTRTDQELNSNMSQNLALPEDERRELRIWMRKKQRERLAVYQKHRKNLREMEHRPFYSPTAFKSVNKNPYLKAKVDHNRVLNNFNQRTVEACNLASDISTKPSVIQGFSDSVETFTARSSATNRVYNSSVRNKCPLALPCTHLVGSKQVPSDEYRKRLGIDRPVKSLPRDRLSQVTRRGMVSCAKSPKSNAQDDKMTKGSPSKSTAVEREYPTKMKNLERASGTYRISGGEESHDDVTELDNGQKEQSFAAAGGTQWDWLDNLSETGSSNLSKIDWDAIERMVSEET